MGEADDLRAAFARLERRVDQIDGKMDRMSDKIEHIVVSQAKQEAHSVGLQRCEQQIAELRTTMKPLLDQQPFVEMMTDTLRKILKGIVSGAWIVGAALLLGQVWPYMPWVHQPTVPVEIKAPK